MTAPSPLATSGPWDLVAADYVRELVPTFEQYSRDALRIAAPPAGSRIVDVACGPGTLTLLAARQGHTVDALDFAPAMIAQLEQRAAGANLAITARVGDGQALPYADGTFAAGFSLFGLMFFPDRAKGFAELRRVVAPGARVVVGSWSPLAAVPALAAMFTALRGAFADVLGPDAPKPGEAPNPLSSEADCIAEMSAAFADVQVHRVAHVQSHASVDAFWASSILSAAPLRVMRHKVGDERWQLIETKALTMLRELLGTGPVALAMPALLTVGTAR